MSFLLLAFAWADEPGVGTPGPAASAEAPPDPADAPPAESSPDPADAPPAQSSPDPADAPPARAPAAEAPEARATSLYLEALEAWQRGDVATADRLSGQALALAPDFEEARLLRGFAQTRLGEPGGAEALQALAADDRVAPEIRDRAARVSGRITDRYRRDQVTAMAGWGVGVEQRYDAASSEVRLDVALEVPVWRFLRVRAEGVFSPFEELVLGIGGPVFGVGPAASLPLGKGVWSVGGSAQLALFAATGPYWEEGGQAQLGARLTAGLDVRPWRRVGVALEAGTNLWPGLWVQLPWYGQPVDARLMLKLWVGK